jgi:hypothetical protein
MPSVLSEHSISKLSVPELQDFLADRGVKCKGCSERQHFVDEAIKHRKKKKKKKFIQSKVTSPDGSKTETTFSSHKTKSKDPSDTSEVGARCMT